MEGGSRILSSVVSSQVEVHSRYGGVVPELASRMHIEAISAVVGQALRDANIKADDITGVAATKGPGLIGALLVGFSYAKAFAYARKIPFAGVNHLEAHIYSLFLSKRRPELPFTVLVVSGGHTNIYYVDSPDRFELMGQTRDDAAGEAFDKVAKMMDLGYPGGPLIEKIAAGQPCDTIQFPRTMLEKGSFDFSFSGLKSAVGRHLHDNPVQSQNDKGKIAASFQQAVIDVLAAKLIQAARHKRCRTICVAGGVSANTSFVDHLSKNAEQYGMMCHSPPAELCGDNAAMVAARGHVMIENRQLCSLDDDVFSRGLKNT